MSFTQPLFIRLPRLPILPAASFSVVFVVFVFLSTDPSSVSGPGLPGLPAWNGLLRYVAADVPPLLARPETSYCNDYYVLEGDKLDPPACGTRLRIRQLPIASAFMTLGLYLSKMCYVCERCENDFSESSDAVSTRTRH